MANINTETRMPPKYEKLNHGMFHSERVQDTPISTLATTIGALLTVLFVVVLAVKLFL